MAGAKDGEHRRPRLIDRVVARWAGRARVDAGIAANPLSRSAGRLARGRQLIAGRFPLAGEAHDLPGGSIWDLACGPLAEADRQSFGWLDDLAAVGDAAARDRARTWVLQWIARFGRGGGPGWQPGLTGRRVMHWLDAAALIRRGMDADADRRLAESLARQVIFLSRRATGAQAGLVRIQALSGQIHGGLVLTGMAGQAVAGAAGLARHVMTEIDAEGRIASRNPEALCDILSLLLADAEALALAEQAVPPEIRAAIGRIAPTLRALRHADGGLARFHGGGPGTNGRLDAALAAAGTRNRRDGLAMGFARLAAGRTTVVMDAAPPPDGAALAVAHASTLAFEMTSGRRPVVVNCGAGEGFGSGWARAARATASQSTLGLDGYSSSRFGADRSNRLTELPAQVPGEFATTPTSHRFGAAHDGWLRTHGLTHARTLDLTLDGRALTGEELLIALSDADQALFDRVLLDHPSGIGWSVRFHLHPEAEAHLDLGGAAVSIALKSGEVWIFRQDGASALALMPSVWLDRGRVLPRVSTQVVLSGRAMAYATRVRWSLAKAQDTPNALRDLGPGADGAEDDEDRR